MPSTTVLITAQAVEYACPIDAFAWGNGLDRIAVWSSAPVAVRVMDIVKKTDASAKRGKYILNLVFPA